MTEPMERFWRIAVAALLAALMLSLTFTAGFACHWWLNRNQPDAGEAQDFGIFWEAWRIVEEQFNGELPTPKQMTYGAVHGALSTLNDPYTVFVEPQPRELEKAELEGRFGGIGAYVRQLEDGRISLSPMPDSPAAEAGMQDGDILLKVDDAVISATMPVGEVILLIRGPVDTQVKLTVQREGADEPIVLTITRKIIETPSVEWRILEQDASIGYIRITPLFSGRTGKELRAALADLKDKGATSFILDLRDNGGGLVDSAVEVASQFLSDGVVFYEQKKDDQETFYPVLSGGVARDAPLAVLVNRGTASASEIVAGALQDHERAPLIGETTYGKGSVQFVYDLSDNSSIHVTVARWLTPNRHRIDKEGLKPTIELPLTDEDRANQRDPQLERAIAYLQSRD
jgi:carboxyl-terminal processing protease